jgi:exodeoxyribonuclease VII large subunit
MTAARRALEGISVRVIGEVSEFNDKPGYKAAYFSVCDGDAVMPCMMWRDAYSASGVRLECGALVEMSGRFSAYVPKGRMQFQVKSLALAGEGVLRIQVAALARKLEAEGLMRADRKRPLPGYPQRIAVVTSPRGKAIHDVVRTLRRRYPLAELLVAGVAVEGAGAVGEMVRGLEIAADASPDVVLLVRGGGSYEDLMPFNAEEIARAVVASPVPVVTGIGHEPDTSIADMVADVRASTPTAAAEAVAPSVDELRQRLDKDSMRLAAALKHRIQTVSHRVAVLAGRPVFSEPAALLGPAAQRVDFAAQALQAALPARLQRDEDRLGYARRALRAIGPRVSQRASEHVRLSAARLEDLSPLKVLGRGWSMTVADDGRTVISSVGQVAAGDSIGVRVRDGSIGCRVESVKREDEDE